MRLFFVSWWFPLCLNPFFVLDVVLSFCSLQLLGWVRAFSWLFILLVVWNSWLLCWCFVLSSCVCSLVLPLFFAFCFPICCLSSRARQYPGNYLLRATLESERQQVGQAINRFDRLRCVSVDTQPGLQAAFPNQPSDERGPTLHPHHMITHNPQRWILKIYNKTIVIPHGSFHNTT